MSGGDGGHVLRLRVSRPPRDASGHVDLDAIAHTLRPCDVLETAGDGTGWSYVAPHDGAVLRDDGRRTVLDHPDGHREELGTDPFTAIDTVCDRLGITPGAPVEDGPDVGPLTGGLLGALSYDLARRVERLEVLAHDDRDRAHLHLRQVDLLVAVDPDRDAAWVVGRDPLGRGELRRRADRLLGRLSHPDPAPSLPPPPTARTATTTLPRDAYVAAVEAILERIAAGDVFQVNLAQRLTAHWPHDTHALYRALRAQSAAPYGAALPDIGLASISPETFLRVDGHEVATRPIKGTRPRSSDPRIDAAHADDLVTSDKDRAENVMVVDLERNDLGRVCEPGTVRVPDLLRLEGHPTVWHLVSTVSGRLRSEVGFGTLLRATFPCGSITGAPKVAAMSLIERLEPVRRDWYCGAVGFLSPGRARLSVAIRTATLLDDGRVDHGAGGGIVADSEPEAEHAESLDKAAAFLRTVGARPA